jgi:hypothetical protein
VRRLFKNACVSVRASACVRACNVLAPRVYMNVRLCVCSCHMPSALPGLLHSCA